ncbi:hypothetical protein RJ641_025106 [Dillenia turbinata]|uniref:Uncharacterized protein n=1 Tax=Dillenia turbinata TaxID=194707 RepID=A0AAN8W0W7_9MAGN
MFLADSDLFDIAGLCISLMYLNLKGCVSISDVGLSRFIDKCKVLHSIVASDTSFGKDSVAVLCSGISGSSRASKLLKLHIGGCYDIDEATLQELVSQLYLVKSLCLRNTNLVDDALYSFSGSSLERLHVSSTKVSGAALAYLVRKNPSLKNFKARDCKNLCQQERNGELYSALRETFSIEKISLGWGFTPFSLEALKPAITSMRTISVGLGGSLGQDALTKLPVISPMLQKVSLYFQVLSDDVIQSIMKSLSHLQMLALCYCLGDISPSSFNISMPNLKMLMLERVTPWMTNDHLIILTGSFPNLIKLSLLGCKFLNLDSQVIIAQRWPGLISLRLESLCSLGSFVPQHNYVIRVKGLDLSPG